MGKHTHYFATYADAYNYYPDGIPSTEIAIVGDASYVFVSSDNSYSGNTTFFDANMTNDEIVDTMNETAYNAGTTYGYEVGFDEGYDDGYDEGFADGVDSVPTPEGNIDITTTSQYDVTTYATAQIADANLTAGNIANGVTILGVTGSYEGGGFTPEGTYFINDTETADVSAYAYAVIGTDANLAAENIKSGVTVLGVQGTYAGLQPSGKVLVTGTNEIDVRQYAYAQVDMMTANLSPSNIKYGETILGIVGSYSGLQPSGTMYIENTMPYDVTTYSTAQVSDMNLTAGNIVNGVTILGVTGNYTGGGGIVPSGTYYIWDTYQNNVANYEYAQVGDYNLTSENIKNGVTILGITGTYVGTPASTDYYLADQASKFVNVQTAVGQGCEFTTYQTINYTDIATYAWSDITDMVNYGFSYNYVMIADKITSNGVVNVPLTTGQVSLTGNTMSCQVELNAGDEVGFSLLNWIFVPDPSMPPMDPDDPPMGTYECSGFYWLSDATTGNPATPHGHWLTAETYTGTWEAEWDINNNSFRFTYMPGSTPSDPTGGETPGADTPSGATCPRCGGTGTYHDLTCEICMGTGYAPAWYHGSNYNPASYGSDPAYDEGYDDATIQVNYNGTVSSFDLTQWDPTGAYPYLYEVGWNDAISDYTGNPSDPTGGETPGADTPSGGDDPETPTPCATCMGTGQISYPDAVSGDMMFEQCPDCGGTGFMPTV